MRCPDTKSLVDVFYEEATTEDHARVLMHLEECPDCNEQWTRLRAVLAVADRWTVPSPSPGIAERALARIAVERVRYSPSGVPRLALPHPLGLLLFGAVAASLSLLFTSGVHEDGEKPLTIGLMGAVWTALYVGVGRLTLHDRYRHLALAALAATAISLLAAPVLSMPAVIEASHRWLAAAQPSALLNGAILLAGALYASTPAFFSGVTIARASPNTILADATWLAVVYALLIAPSVCLQCWHLALGLTVAWVAGMLAGAFLGSLGGVSMAVRLRMATT